MNGFQRNAGTAGLAAGVLLIILFGLFFSLGREAMAVFSDPAKALPLIKEKSGVLGAIGILGPLTSALGILLAAGLAARLRDRAPTRATAQLYFAVIGLSALALDGVIRWMGGTQLASRTADQVAAGHAYIALNAVGIGIAGFGSLFVGVSLILVGWAITATRALSGTLGWVGMAAGVVTAAGGLVPPDSPLFLLSFVLTIVWLLWAGAALRGAATM
jgi:hypothetical protein